MAKITRKTAKIFGSSAAATDIEQFGSKTVTGIPNYTTDPAVIQGLAAWADGWSAALVVTNNSEYKQDRNAVDYVASYQIAYLLQQGIAEWDPGTTYFINSFVQYNGQLYISQADNNINQTPPASGSTTYWQTLYFIGNAPQPTRTVLTSGSGTYTPPVGVLQIRVRMIGGGGGGFGSSAGTDGGDTTFGAFTAGGGKKGTSTNGGAGGTASGGSVNISGSRGSIGTGGTVCGGAASAFGGAGVIGISVAFPGVTNSGGGGAGSPTNDGSGGGAGAYLEGIVNSPTGTSYAVGAGGTGGAGGGGGAAAGGSGIIIIDEYYY